MSYAVSWLTRRPPVQHISQPGPLVLVGVPRLAWTDTSPKTDPALWDLAREGAAGAMSTRSLSPHSCTSQSWMTLSASTRTSFGHQVEETHGARTTDCPGVAHPPTINGETFFPKWSKWREKALSRPMRADIGRLGSSLRDAGQCINAYRPYAALGAADRDGLLTHYSRYLEHVDLTECPVTFIAPSTYDDDFIASLVKKLPKNATLVVAGMGDDSKPERFHTVVIAGPGVPHGQLTSSATRQPGVIQLTDLSALVLSRLGAAAPNLPEGRVPVVQPTSSPTEPAVRAAELTTTLQVEHGFVLAFFMSYLGPIVIILAGCALWFWRRRRRGLTAGTRLRVISAATAGMAAALPISTFIVNVFPWWRAGHPRLALAGLITACAAVLTAAAFAGPWRRWKRGPMLFLAGMTMFVLCLDVVQGSRLQFVSMMGLQPVYGGRFYGNGNMGYALLATTSILIAATLAGKLIEQGYRQLAATTVILVGGFTVLVDGYPSWGADGGGPAALIPAFGYLALNAAGVRLTWKRIAVIGSSTVVIVGGLAVLDYLRGPQHRTHLGDFVSNVRNHGNFSGLERIWEANWNMLTSSLGTTLVPFLLMYCVAVLAKPELEMAAPIRPLLERVTFLGHGLAAMVVCWLLAFFSNDSGTAIPPGGLMIAVPLLIVLAANLPWPAPEQVATADRGRRGSPTTPPAGR